MAVCISGMKFWDVAVSFFQRLQVKESFLVSIFLRNSGVIANDHSQAPLLLENMRSPFGSLYARSINFPENVFGIMPVILLLICCILHPGFEKILH